MRTPEGRPFDRVSAPLPPAPTCHSRSIFKPKDGRLRAMEGKGNFPPPIAERTWDRSEGSPSLQAAMSSSAPDPAGCLGRNGIPHPAGAGGGSSSSSLPLLRETTLLSHRARTRGSGCERAKTRRSSVPTGPAASSEKSARLMASTSTTQPLSSRRNEGAFSTARESDIHEASTARFSAFVSDPSQTTSSG